MKEYKQRKKSAIDETKKRVCENIHVYMKEYRKNRKCSTDEAEKCAQKRKQNTPMKEYRKKKKLDSKNEKIGKAN